MLIWPIFGIMQDAGVPVAAVLYTSPLEFVADIDRVVVRTTPRTTQWVPTPKDLSEDIEVGIACAIVSTSL
jgi:hypothetical protein